jgi:hypothetical protein
MVNSSLLALPVAVVIARKLLQNRRILVIAGTDTTTERMNQIQRRAHTLTDTLKNIVGYNHSGLNE